MTYADPAPDEAGLFAEVRRLKVHEPDRAAFVPVVVGYWLRDGRTRCLDHPPEIGQVLDVIAGDNSAVEGDRCDWPGCGVSILAAAIGRARQGQPFASVTDGTLRPLEVRPADV
jgi:hypothetical protein